MSDGDSARAAFDLAPWNELDPRVLVRSKEDRLGTLFLSLAVVFNDYKGVLLLERHLNIDLKRPPTGEISEVAAEWHGLAVQVHRLLAAITSEMINLLSENESVLEDAEMADVHRLLVTNFKQPWKWLLEAARELKAAKKKDPKSSVTLSAEHELLRVVRDKLTYHYGDKALDKATIVRGFHEQFFVAPKNERNRIARYSAGTVHQTRFFYADGSLQMAMKLAHRDGGDDFDKKIVELSASAFGAVGAIVAAFIAARSSSIPRGPGRSSRR